MFQKYVQQIVGATKYSLAGLHRAFVSEKAFQLETATFAVIIILLLILRPEAVWVALSVIGWLSVLALELINSSLEEAFDLISTEYSEHIKFGKDMASAALFVLMAGNAVLWLCLFYHVLH